MLVLKIERTKAVMGNLMMVRVLMIALIALMMELMALR